MKYILSVLCIGLALVACDKIEEEAQNEFINAGFSQEAATQLSTMELDAEEIQQVIEARKEGINETAIISMVKSLDDQDLKFDLTPSAKSLLQAGVSNTTLTRLVEMQAVPRWTDDIRALKEVGVADVTILEVAREKFEKNKEVLSGNEYAMLKRRGLSDEGLLAFVRSEGDRKELQELADALQLGKPEQEALQLVGVE